MNRTEYFTKIRENRDILARQSRDESCFIISVKAVNNGPCEVNLDIAARCITEGSHRLATDLEAK